MLKDLKSDQGILHPLVSEGEGAQWNPQENHFPSKNFVMTTTLYVYAQKTIIFNKNKNGKKNAVSKWRSNNRFLAFLDENLKNKPTFLKECFNEFLFIVGEHEYIYVAGVKLGNWEPFS